MRFVVIQGVVLNTEAIDMIVPQEQQCTVFLRGGSEKLVNLSAEELLAHLHHEEDHVVRLISEAGQPQGVVARAMSTAV